MEKYFFINHLDISKHFADMANNFVKLTILHNIVKNHKQKEEISGFYCIKDILRENSNDFYTISDSKDLKPFEDEYLSKKSYFLKNYMMNPKIEILEVLLNTNDFWLDVNCSFFGLNSLKIDYPAGQDDYSFNLILSLISTKGPIRQLLELKYHIDLDNLVFACNLENNFYTIQNGKIYSCLLDKNSTYMIREELLLRNHDIIEKAINHETLNKLLSSNKIQKELVKI